MVVPFLRPHVGNAAIVEGMAAGDPHAAHVFCDRFGAMVNRLVWRLLGADNEHDDVVHDVFINAFNSIRSLKDPERLGQWIAGVTVNTVHREIRKRRLLRILHLVPDVEFAVRCLEGEDAVVARRFYAAIRAMKTDDRIAFVLRFVEELELGEVATACGCSLATAKRRVARARAAFAKRARRDPVLAAYAGEDDA